MCSDVGSGPYRSVESAVRRFLNEALGKDTRQLGAHDSLLETGTLDSIGVMQLVAFLEETYNISVPDDDLLPDNFETIAAITAFVDRRRGPPDV